MNALIRRIPFILIVMMGLLVWSGTGWSDCGPGPVVTSNSKGIIQQVLGATTNASFLPTQALAITTGTSGCSNSGVVDAEMELRRFAAWNLPRIEVEAARGEGAYLVALADLFGCSPGLEAAFAQSTHTNFDRVFAQPAKDSDATMARLREALSSQTRLTEGCSRLS